MENFFFFSKCQVSEHSNSSAMAIFFRKSEKLTKAAVKGYQFFLSSPKKGNSIQCANLLYCLDKNYPAVSQMIAYP